MIEVYHRTRKSGCRIEERQHDTARALENCLAIDMVIAARILHRTWIGCTCPDLPCTVYCENKKWKAMYCFLNKTPTPPQKVPSLRERVGVSVTDAGGLDLDQHLPGAWPGELDGKWRSGAVRDCGTYLHMSSFLPFLPRA